MRGVLSIGIVLLVAGCADGGDPTAEPSVTLPAATTPPAPTAAAIDDPTPTATSDVATRIRTLLGSEFNGSALVSHGGDILLAEGIGMADDTNGIANMPATRFRIGSITKQFTAMAVLMLASHGLLKTSDPVCDYVDTCPEGWGAITIEHLLGHTSGIANVTDQPAFDPTKAATPAETVAIVADIPLAFAPGGRGHTATPGTSCLAW